MKVPHGAIDCDIHPAVPATTALLPYLPDYWREAFLNRHIERYPFTLMSYPPNAPASCRPDWRPEQGLPGSDLAALQRQALDAFGVRFAICNVLHGAIALFNEDMAAALAAAVNDWTAKELLDRDPRLRGSILLPIQNPDLAVAEIERLAGDPRFVQVLMLVMGDALAGSRRYWPIYAAAERHGLPVALHAGSTFRTAPTYSGWPSFQVEDYVANSAAFENVLMSFIAEGVFQKFPDLKLVCSEAGFTWLPTLLWRANKEWRGIRAEVPWVKSPPADILRGARALHPAAGRGARRRDLGTHARAHRLRRGAALLHRLSALALRRRGRAARRPAGGDHAPHAGRQSARDLPAARRRD